MDKLIDINEAANLIKVNPETLRRWDRDGKLIAIKVNERGDRRYKETDILEFIKINPKIIRYSQIIKYKGYSIAWDSEGYASMTGNFGVIGKLTAEKEDSWTGFAFAVAGLSLFARTGLKDDLDNLPIKKIKEYIDKGLIFDGDVFTFEFENGDFHEVQNPEWWEGKYGKTLTRELRIEVEHASPTTIENKGWRVILKFKSKNGSIWVANTFGEKNNFVEYFVWVDSNELKRMSLSNNAKSVEIIAINFGIKRFEETKDKNGDRDITRIGENNSAFYDGKWVKNSILPDRLMK